MSATARRVSPELIVLAGCLIALITFGPRASAGPVPDPDDDRIRLGPRRLRPRHRAAEPALGRRPALRGRGRRPVRRVARAVRRRAALRARPRRSWPMRRRPGCCISAPACSSASASRAARSTSSSAPSASSCRRNGGRMAFGAGTAAGSLRAVPVPADRQHPHRRASAGIRRSSSSPRRVLARAAALARARDPARRRGAARRAGAGREPVDPRRRWPRPSSTAPTCCSCSASSPAASSSPSSPRICRPISRMPGSPASVGGWTLAVIGLANAVGSLSAGWLSTRMSKRWLLAWIYLGALGRDRRLHPDAGLAR